MGDSGSKQGLEDGGLAAVGHYGNTVMLIIAVQHFIGEIPRCRETGVLTSRSSLGCCASQLLPPATGQRLARVHSCIFAETTGTLWLTGFETRAGSLPLTNTIEQR